MALRYTSDELIHLRNSPLCIKPSSLPPAEEWMGPPPENFRNSQGSKTGNDRTRQNDGNLLEQTNRRPGPDRHISRNSANPDDIILGPPRTMFNSTLSRTAKPFDDDKTTKDADNRDRFAFRTRNGELDSNDRFRERDGRNNFRRRGEGEDSDGWSTVKPRKSFGAEGAERFHGRMGERPDRFGGERRTRDSEDRDSNTTDRPRRNFGEFAREKEGDDADKMRRNNGLNRNRSDLPWNRETNDAPQPRERFDRSKSWREKTEDNQLDAQRDRPKERQYERRWDRDRDQRQEREPEWLDEPYEDPNTTHTPEDFKKFMEAMKNKASAIKAADTPQLSKDVLRSDGKGEAEVARPKSMKSTPVVELGPDKFFAAFGQKPAAEAKPEGEAANEKPTPAPKASRFQNFFSSQEEARRQPEPPTPAAPPPAPAAQFNPLLALTGLSAGSSVPQDSSEKQAFQLLLQKLQKQNLQASTPPSGGFPEPPPSHEYGAKNVVSSPGSNQLYAQDRDFTPRAQLQPQEILAPRPQQNNQFMSQMRPEQQMLHDLIGQRHSSQNSRGEQPSSRNSNPNTEFLVSLMQGGRGIIPEPQRNEQPVMRMPQPSRPAQVPPAPDREPEFYHERGSSQHQIGSTRPGGLGGFFDEAPMHRREPESRPQQPTHILQRPGAPPGLDQMPPPSWMQAGGQQLPTPGGRPMIPPPGLPGAQRNGPIPGNYPNFPMGGYPPDVAGPPPRNMPPPPGFYAPPPPPPGFMPHPGMGNFQGPESLAFVYDGRGMPPPGAGGQFRRQ
ncbi:hypothetical protein F5Y16DRAFT_375288 [Xylariaceae sp. FL0255]|nr:hypothetical protein F5Y16DRAFT_375288 [Xylariaceae sp. FL0255]